MILAIDYDNTYTAAPELWEQVIKLFQDAGHTVICITGRTDNMAQPVLDTIGKLVPVIFAGKDWKRDAAKKHGYKVDVWIDDVPEMVGKQHLFGQ
jgi:acid phosphatase class B